MHHGGTVPAGYPKDTFPAMLSSGEQIIPAGQRKEQPIKVVIPDGFWELDGVKLKYVTDRAAELIAQTV